MDSQKESHISCVNIWAGDDPAHIFTIISLFIGSAGLTSGIQHLSLRLPPSFQACYDTPLIAAHFSPTGVHYQADYDRPDSFN
jgi:hypothetical protein